MAADFSDDIVPQFFRVNQPKNGHSSPSKRRQYDPLETSVTVFSADTVKRLRRLRTPMFCYSCAAVTHRLKYINQK
jgi:hypothetical protein